MDAIHAILQRIIFPIQSTFLFLKNRRKESLTIVLATLFFLTVLYALFVYAPYSFPREHTFSIEEGSSLGEIASNLHEENVIRSPLLMKVVVSLLGKQLDLQAGDYYFHKPINLFGITERIIAGNYGLEPVTVRIPEGATIFDIASIFFLKFNSFDKNRFVALALEENAEGYLFPDTYQFMPNVKEEKVLKTLRDNFDAHIVEIETHIQDFGVPLSDVVILASLIEKESANDLEERRMISGILWNRLQIGMALQVDAVFPYINGKNTFELSVEDLGIDSPYNTYKYPGLPIGPIANPSLDSLLAAVTPTKNEYFFYLHDMSGNIHYSVDFEGHKRNKFRYLR